MAACAGIVELLYGFYYARLWLSVCLANIAVTAILHRDRWGQQLPPILPNHMISYRVVSLNFQKAFEWYFPTSPTQV